MLAKIKLAFGSRTFWVIVIAIVTNTINANAPFIPVPVLDVLNTVLGLLATYFHVNPAQNYNTPTTNGYQS